MISRQMRPGDPRWWRCTRRSCRASGWSAGATDTFTATWIRGPPCSSPRSMLATSLVEHPVTEGMMSPAIFRQIDELRRRHDAPYRMVPAHERLDPNDAAGREAEYRLVMEHELARGRSRAQLALELEALVQTVAGARRRLRHDPARLLGQVDRRVGVAQQIRRQVARVSLEEHDPDADGDEEIDDRRSERLAECLRIRVATLHCGSGSVTSSRSTVNSSPPRRATVSAGRTTAYALGGPSRSTSSPDRGRGRR